MIQTVTVLINKGPAKTYISVQSCEKDKVSPLGVHKHTGQQHHLYKLFDSGDIIWSVMKNVIFAA